MIPKELPPGFNCEVTGAENLADNKFRVHLKCGHSLICDHSVDDVRTLAVVNCPLCQEGKPA